MPLKELGLLLLVLLVIVVVGNLWFHAVESVLEKLKGLFVKKEPPVWHPLPPEQEEKEDP